MGKLFDKLKIAFDTGFFHIMICNVINNIFAFIAGVMLVRIVSKDEYGIFAYANNTLSYFLLFSGLGMTSAVFQVCCECRDQEKKAQSVFGYGFRCGYAVNLLLSLVILGYSLLFGGSIRGTGTYLACMSFLPVVNITLEYITIYFRSRMDNKRYAYILIINSALVCVCSISGALLYGVYGIIMSNYLTPILCFIIARLFLEYDFVLWGKRLAKKMKADLWKMAVTAMGSNAISSLMYLIDISMVGMFMRDEKAVASYKIATTIPTALNFISLAVITYIYPYFASHIDDIKWTKSMVKKLILGACALFGMISFGMFALADVIVPIIFGAQYQDAVPVFRILSVSFFFQSAFRVIFGNLLVTQRKLNFNLIESILTGIVNIAGDYILIRQFEAVGVALATLIVMVFSGMLSMSYYLYALRKKEKTLEGSL